MSPESTVLGNRPLMVIDDDSAIREAIATVVEAEGYPVVTASGGAEAFGCLRSGLQPGVILLDLRMPEMDGRTFRELQKRDPQLAAIPVVLLSGDRDVCRAAAELNTACLMKPIDLDELLSLAKRFCCGP